VIAEARGISDRFLLKVLKPLVSAQILNSVKGPSGGYKLARRVSSISLLNVLEAVDGPIRGCAPPGKGEKDSTLAKCLDHIFCHCAEEYRKNLDRIKISELVGS
jgi:Rrf2 family protein